MSKWAKRSLDSRLDELLTHAVLCSNGCLELHERLDTSGYPVLAVFYKERWRTKKVASWLLYREYGEIAFSKGMVTRHLCNNRLCINLHHLAYGTYRDNSFDSGGLDQSVQQIIAEEYDPVARNGEKLASEFRVTRQRIHQIVALYAPWKKVRT